MHTVRREKIEEKRREEMEGFRKNEIFHEQTNN